MEVALLRSPQHRRRQHQGRMRYGQVVIGPPGSGKSTYCHGVHQFFTALDRPVAIVNLDPAVHEPTYPCALNVTELISLDDAMEAHGLGPNGAMLFCLEYLDQHKDEWLAPALDRVCAQFGDDESSVKPFIVFDTPGQVELSTDHESLKNVIEWLARKGWRLCATHLVDAHHITDASKYISLLLLSLRTMLQMELPHINVLSKVDLLRNAGELAFNLDYYTDVQDLDQLLPLLESDKRTAKFAHLNRLICEIVEDFSLVNFETLCVEVRCLSLCQRVDLHSGLTCTLTGQAVNDEADAGHRPDARLRGAHLTA